MAHNDTHDNTHADDKDDKSSTSSSTNDGGVEQEVTALYALVMVTDTAQPSTANGIQSAYDAVVLRARLAMNARISEFIEAEQARYDRFCATAQRHRDQLFNGCGSAVDNTNTGEHIHTTTHQGQQPLQQQQQILLDREHEDEYDDAGLVPRRWSNTTGTDSAVPPSPLHYGDDMSDSMLFGEEVDELRDRLGAHQAKRGQLGAGNNGHESDDSGTFVGTAFHSASNRNGAQFANRTRSTDAAPIGYRTTSAAKGAGLLCALGTSLPVTIPAKYWPPRDAVDSPRPDSPVDGEDDDTDGSFGTKQPKNVCLPHRNPKNPHEQMVELSRSIQAADDPERLFGERPNRRRHLTGDKHTGMGVTQRTTTVQPLVLNELLFEAHDEQ